jgi:hypothetical protein
MPVHRFNWDNWDTVVTNSDGTKEGDVYRTDNTYECSTLIPGVSSVSPTSGPIEIPGLSGCQLFMPPRIDEVNIMPSSQIQLFIYGDGIQ